MWQIVFVGSRSKKESYWWCALFHFIAENEIIYILMYVTETRQLGLEPESARKEKLQTRSKKLPVRALNKLLKTQAGDISPYFYENSLRLRVYNIMA